MADAESIFVELRGTPINGDSPKELNIPRNLDASGIVQLMKDDSNGSVKDLLRAWELLPGLEVVVTVIDTEGKRTTDSWVDGDR